MTEPKDQPTKPADEDDTSGHSLGDDYARQHAAERAREADQWATREAIRKVAKSPLDRLRGR
jgi:hypothetical protein